MELLDNKEIEESVYTPLKEELAKVSWWSVFYAILFAVAGMSLFIFVGYILLKAPTHFNTNDYLILSWIFMTSISIVMVGWCYFKYKGIGKEYFRTETPEDFEPIAKTTAGAWRSLAIAFFFVGSFMSFAIGDYLYRMLDYAYYDYEDYYEEAPVPIEEIPVEELPPLPEEQ